MGKYVEILKIEVVEDTRFDVPGRNQGQIIEVAYGGHSRSRTEHSEGAEYMRVHDQSQVRDAITYYQLAEHAPVEPLSERRWRHENTRRKQVAVELRTAQKVARDQRSTLHHGDRTIEVSIDEDGYIVLDGEHTSAEVQGILAAVPPSLIAAAKTLRTAHQTSKDAVRAVRGVE